ncbi:aminotransferase class V-fold PLP-dependent enzyme [Streptomyces niveiscabiei]|uniref:cysteine desulfurase/sulfurtransferase TusA family protein n=1 Tax=Streptomyces niveiscabiei TaxID=164115 RepID=UPI0029BF7A4B|nr:aminotransferase class V-fold PLP-dependent enzyme [Streptomyces niveiscabiei]MDX3381191.1 aminotransferase class V-fold PLP-dependent enzyme [Streptomyces niveiscabiei]
MPFFDAASGSPLHPVARQALLASLEDGWADPGKLYREGRKARVLLDAAREAAAEAIGCRADEVRFTSSGTRAVQVGMAGVLAGRRRVGAHLIVSSVEHSSVLHVAEQWDGEVTQVPVGRLGAVGVEGYREALRGDTALACLQAANHEVGTVQPVGEVAEVCGDVPLLVDAAQVLGWGDVPEGWSVLTGSARKWGGPAGVGVLAVRKGVRFAPREDEEFGNLPAVVAAVASLRAVRADAAVEAVRVRELTSRIRERVARLVPDVEVVGDPERRLPGIVTFSCLYVDGETLLHELDRAGFAVSSGSSCTSDTLTPSHVLKAMGVLSEGNVRVSLPAGVAEADVERFLDVLPGVVAGVREKLGAEVTPVQGTVVDSLGKRCPIPVIELAKAIRNVPVGAVVTVLADDEAARLDIPAWCEMTGHEYVGEEPREKGRAYVIRRIK